jgi:hypothetical protein
MDQELETQETDEQVTDGYQTTYRLYYVAPAKAREWPLILADAPPPRDR